MRKKKQFYKTIVDHVEYYLMRVKLLEGVFLSYKDANLGSKLVYHVRFQDEIFFRLNSTITFENPGLSHFVTVQALVGPRMASLHEVLTRAGVQDSRCPRHICG